ncbi:hypothetical protein LTR27_012293 [Elasticomyces elasticus]|nr:hypothetical protein LTR27_012293 [Elasticomyces elasticus]
MEKPYVYRKLDAKRQEIRLLEVLPDEPGKPVRVNIRVVQLPAAYETISYAWGNPARSGCIEVRMKRRRRWSRQLRVPLNTEAALKRVRLVGRSRMVWIDAVCINQDDKLERSQQVAIMGSIYASSIGNLTHLGDLEDADMAARIQSTIDNLLIQAKHETNDLRTFDSFLQDQSQTEQMQRRGLHFDVDDEAVCLMLKLPWFRRLWVLQEAVMAPRSIALLGPLQLDLYDMLRALVWWAYHSTTIHSEIAPGNRCAYAIYFHVSQRGYAGAPSLEVLLTSALSFQKSEPRDAIFALLAMMDERSSSALSPDYTKPLWEILQTASRMAIEEGPTILRYIVHRPGDLEQAELASWAVRVDREADYQLDPSIFLWREDQNYMVSKWRDYSPSRGWESRVLGLKGHQADSVILVTPLCSASIYDDSDAFLTWLRQVYTSVDASSSHGIRAKALAKTLCIDNYQGRQYHNWKLKRGSHWKGYLPL